MQSATTPLRPQPTSQGSAAGSHHSTGTAAAPGAGASNVQPVQRRHYPDSERITRILQSMGVNHFDPKVVSVLREFLFFYSADVLERATTVSKYAEKPLVDPEDIRVAVKLKIAHSREFSHRPDRATLEKWAEHKNACPMPPIPKRDGIPLPQERFCLNAVNFQILAQDPKVAAQEKAAQQQQQQQPKKRKGKYGARPAKKTLKIVLKFKR